MRIAVIGATGVLGRHLVPRLVERGHAVCATARRDADLDRLKRIGAEAVAADIFDPASLRAAVVNCDAAVHAATSIPTAAGRGDWAVNDRIRREGTANLLAACRAERVRRYVQQSVAMLHLTDDSRPQTEDDPLGHTDRIRSALEMEQMVSQAPLDWCIVRGGAFYGPGTGRPEAWRSQARGGVLTLPGDGNGFLSIRKTLRTFPTGNSSSLPSSSVVGSRPSFCWSIRWVLTSLLMVSIMCTGMRMVRAWSAMARVMAWRTHQVA